MRMRVADGWLNFRTSLEASGSGSDGASVRKTPKWKEFRCAIVATDVAVMQLLATSSVGARSDLLRPRVFG